MHTNLQLGKGMGSGVLVQNVTIVSICIFKIARREDFECFHYKEMISEGVDMLNPLV
jgi:hypothetical protein